MTNDAKYHFHVQTNYHHCFVFPKTTVAIQLHSQAFLSPHQLLTTSQHGMLCSMTHHHSPVMVPVVPVIASPAAVAQEQPQVVPVLAVVTSTCCCCCASCSAAMGHLV